MCNRMAGYKGSFGLFTHLIHIAMKLVFEKKFKFYLQSPIAHERNYAIQEDTQPSARDEVDVVKFDNLG